MSRAPLWMQPAELAASKPAGDRLPSHIADATLHLRNLRKSTRSHVRVDARSRALSRVILCASVRACAARQSEGWRTLGLGSKVENDVDDALSLVAKLEAAAAAASLSRAALRCFACCSDIVSSITLDVIANLCIGGRRRNGAKQKVTGGASESANETESETKNACQRTWVQVES